MIWIQLLTYFAVCSAVLFVAFSVYAKLLHFAARFRNPVRMLLGLGIYLVISCVLVSPLAGLVVNETWRLAVNSSPVLAVLFLLGYGLSVFPSALHFKRRHLDELKALGYFKGGSHR